MPSKLLGMLASGKAVIATANPDTEIGRVISQVGILVSPQDALGLEDAILSLAASPHQRRRFGESGRTYVCKNWGADLILPRFLHQLIKLVVPNSSDKEEITC
jgi:colanic acid biosynthesis glycosyl transferase WcaI